MARLIVSTNQLHAAMMGAGDVPLGLEVNGVFYPGVELELAYQHCDGTLRGNQATDPKNSQSVYVVRFPASVVDAFDVSFERRRDEGV